MSTSIDPVAALSVAVVAIFWLAGLSFLSRKNATDIAEMKVQIKQALDAKEGIERLAQAVTFGNTALAKSVSNLAERVAEQALFSKEQFAEIRQEQKLVGQALDRRHSGDG